MALQPKTETATKAKPRAVALGKPAQGQCLCGSVCFEIDVPARWAWHDHSAASRRAHGAAYATYVGSWRKRFRITKGEREIVRYETSFHQNGAQFLLALWNADHIRARALAAYGEYSARAFPWPHRPAAALSHRDRGTAGVGLHRRASGAAEGFSGRGLAALQKEQTWRSRRDVLRRRMRTNAHRRAAMSALALIPPSPISHDVKIPTVTAAGRGGH